ncbi:MAG: signal peptide peptidase SppA [Bacteroidales bacterium]|nr:signal peptide peptidase SppA [Bacteroidales bacterium]MDD4603938.1 signal peptide peptidase SppA [Bacteroidales bacterium]
MKQFFKFMFASMLGTFLVLLILSVISFGIIAAIVASASQEEVVISKNTVLQLKLNKTIADRSSKTKVVMGYSGPEKNTGLNEILDNLKKAKNDDNIAGIYLDLSDIPAGISTVSEIREGLLDFKKSGKFIWAYSEVYSQKSYYLATAADKIFLQPQGAIEFKGLSSEIMFVKGLLEKLDVKMQIIRHGKFKAATEPLFLDKMSPENRKQMTELVNNVWNEILDGIVDTRKISRQELNNLADSLKIQTAEDALKYKFVDQLVYKDELITEMKKKLALTDKQKIQLVTLEKYTDVAEKKHGTTPSDKIAVVYASGSIGSGTGDDESIGSERISKALRKAREDDKVKAIVFRINSGGGSALASDVIWREVDLARQVKPVVASFGDVAASGGYYIACAASKIIADPTTITGSIGVFGVIPNFQGLFSKKLGITFDLANTNKNSDYIPVQKPLTPYQTLLIQRDVDHIYDVFTGKVAAGRKMTKAAVDDIGQGRIWSGTDAKNIGLIDDFGGLSKAIETAAELAKIKNYRILSLPEQKEWFEELINQITGNDPSAKLKQALGENYQYYQYLKELQEMKGVQARLLYDLNLQ